MKCASLPDTGVAHLGVTVLVTVTLLLAGVLVLVLTRPRRGGAVVLFVTLVAGVPFICADAPSARAATSDCVTESDSLSITQTSTMRSLAPGIDAVPIAGVIVNRGADSTFVHVIVVEIISVSKDPTAPAGICDSSDYTVLGARMPVRKALDPGGSATFTGATIGFNNKTSNQDACRHALIHLRYSTAS